jgi:hypothetical protein
MQVCDLLTDPNQHKQYAEILSAGMKFSSVTGGRQDQVNDRLVAGWACAQQNALRATRHAGSPSS